MTVEPLSRTPDDEDAPCELFVIFVVNESSEVDLKRVRRAMDGHDESLEQDALVELAFRYVSGELDAVAEAAFEERLLVDLTACEAVAAAQGTVELVRRAVSTRDVAVVAPQRMARGAAWVRVAAALVMVGGVFGVVTAWRHEVARSVNGEADIAVVAAWAAGAEVLADGGVSDEPLLADNGGADLEVPGWMVTALEHEAEADEPLDN